MRTQLALIDSSDRNWRLDERTKELGLRGVAAARAVLEQVERDRDREAVESAGRDAMATAEHMPAA